MRAGRCRLRNSRVSTASPRILGSNDGASPGKGTRSGSSQRRAGADRTTHLSAAAGEGWGRGGEREGWVPPTDRPPRLRPRPVGRRPRPPDCDVSARGPLNGRPCRLAGSRLAVGGRAGGGRNRGKPCGRRLPWTLSRLVTRLRETWRVAEVTPGSATQGRGRGGNPAAPGGPLQRQRAWWPPF